MIAAFAAWGLSPQLSRPYSVRPLTHSLAGASGISKVSIALRNCSADRGL
jgi:hypothetical protein